MKVKNFLLSAVLILIGFSITSFAQLNSSEIKVLSEKADVILTGKVTQQASSWNENKTRIYTRTTIQVEDYLKGNHNGNTITVTSPGGEVGDIGEKYSHMPSFDNNEELLVFLKKDTKSTDYHVLNGEDGKINLITDPKTGETVTASNVKINAIKAQIKSYITN